MFSSAIRILVAGVACLLFSATLARAQAVGPTNPTVEAEEANETDNSLPWRGTSFSFSQGLSGNSFTRSSTLSYNPTYSWGFSLNLAWHFSKRLSMSLNQELAVELTDSDSTLTKREPQFSDTTLALNALLWKQKLSSEISGTLNGVGSLSAPTSLASQAATLVVGTRLGLTASASFANVMNGLGVSLSTSYLHRFLRSNVAEPVDPYPCSAGAASQSLCNQLGTRSNTRFAISAGVSGNLSLNDQWDVSLGLSRAWRRGADLADFTYVTSDGARVALRDGGENHWRNLTTITAGVSFAALRWLGLGFSASNSFSERGIDGKYRAPLHMTDTLLGLDLTFQLDQIYLAARGKPEKS